MAIVSLLMVAGGLAYWNQKARARRISSDARARHLQGATDGAPYPRSRWRLAPQSELSRVVLWVSHILVRHRDAEVSNPPFAPPDWKALPPPVMRSRDEALERAQAVAARIQLTPSSFPEFATEFSEDTTTSGRGGSLGGVQALQLRLESQVLDAIAALHNGEVSRPIETQHGFEILWRRPPPPPALVGGRHLVIGYSEAPWLGFVARSDKRRPRDRNEAWSLANKLAAEARRDPGSFVQLIRAHSEHRDAEDEGDVGVWSNREVSPYPRMVEALDQLDVGEIFGPMETSLGFEIIQRTPVEPRPEYAAAVIQLRFDSNAPPANDHSQARVAALALDIVRAVTSNPQRFEEFQKEHCCVRAKRWTKGRENQVLTEATMALAVGSIAKDPARATNEYLIIKRLNPADVPNAPSTVFDIPEPASPDLDTLVSRLSVASVAAQTRKLSQIALPSLGLSQAQELEFNHIHEDWLRRLELASGPTGRARMFSDLAEQIEHDFGPKAASTYVQIISERVSEMLMRQPL